MQIRHDFQNFGLYEFGKEAVLAHISSSDIW